MNQTCQQQFFLIDQTFQLLVFLQNQFDHRTRVGQIDRRRLDLIDGDDRARRRRFGHRGLLFVFGFFERFQRLSDPFQPPETRSRGDQRNDKN